MAAIRATNTQPEILVRKALYGLAIRYRLHVKSLPGRPDIVIRRLGLIIQVKGCFWHHHYCLSGRVPHTNRQYWTAKIAGNQQRDRRNERALRRDGWKVVTIWECAIRRWSTSDLSAKVMEIVQRASNDI